MWFPKSSLKSITQLHSPTQEGAEISRERPRCCCIPLASPWIVPSTPGWGEAHRAQALHFRWLRCSPVLWAVGQHCPRARISFSTAAEELRALHKASRATQAAQTAALGVAELGQTLHLEPLCSPCPAPPAQVTVGSPCWGLHGASSHLRLQLLYHSLCLTLLWGHKLPWKLPLNVSNAICEMEILELGKLCKQGSVHISLMQTA